MGRTDSRLESIYKQLWPKKEPIALLGFTDNKFGPGDLYDLSFTDHRHWDINDEWELPKKYGSIVSTRCPYFAKDPKGFIKRCWKNLEKDGEILLDWGLGDHWRFEKYKVGWKKDGEHEFAYAPNNFLWSTVWDGDFYRDPQFLLFADRVKKFGYQHKWDVASAIVEEVPEILPLWFIKEYFDAKVMLWTVWEDFPQLYIFIWGKKK